MEHRLSSKIIMVRKLMANVEELRVSPEEAVRKTIITEYVVLVKCQSDLQQATMEQFSDGWRACHEYGKEIGLSVEGLAFVEYVASLRAKIVTKSGSEDDTAKGNDSSKNGGVGGADVGKTIDGGDEAGRV